MRAYRPAIRQQDLISGKYCMIRRKKQKASSAFRGQSQSWKQGGIEGGFQRRMFTHIKENAYMGSVDMEHSFSNGWLLKAGTMNESKNRDLRLRVFLLCRLKILWH